MPRTPSSTRRKTAAGIKSPVDLDIHRREWRRRALRPGTGREKPHVLLRPPAALVDGEAGFLDRSLGIAVGMTAPGDPGPKRLDGVLKTPGKLALLPHVLEHAKSTLETKDALDLRQAASRIADGAEDQAAHHRIEGAVAERELLRLATHQRNRRRASPGALEHFQIRVHRKYFNARGVEGEVAPGPAA